MMFHDDEEPFRPPDLFDTDLDRIVGANQRSIDAGHRGDYETVRRGRKEDIARTHRERLGDGCVRELSGRVPPESLRTGDLEMWSRHAEGAKRSLADPVDRSWAYCACAAWGVPCTLALDAEDLRCTACREICRR